MKDELGDLVGLVNAVSEALNILRYLAILCADTTLLVLQLASVCAVVEHGDE
jgi:hypothetical protein